MARSVPEWIGKSDDAAIPPRVRIRVWDRCEGKCGQCGRKIRPGEGWTLEHLTALINGGENRERNLGVTCDWCLPAKNAADVVEKAKTYAVKMKHLGIKKPSRGFRKAPPQRTATRELRRKSETETT